MSFWWSSNQLESKRRSPTTVVVFSYRPQVTIFIYFNVRFVVSSLDNTSALFNINHIFTAITLWFVLLGTVMHLSLFQLSNPGYWVLQGLMTSEHGSSHLDLQHSISCLCKTWYCGALFCSAATVESLSAFFFFLSLSELGEQRRQKAKKYLCTLSFFLPYNFLEK